MYVCMYVFMHACMYICVPACVSISKGVKVCLKYLNNKYLQIETKIYTKDSKHDI